MFTNLTILNNAQAMAKHAAARQSLVAQNIANSDTPGYKSRDMVSFQDVMHDRAPKMAMATSRAGHMGANAQDAAQFTQSFEDKSAATSPDGNSVEVEAEILKSIEAERQHSRAITIYQSTMNILRSSIGRGR